MSEVNKTSQVIIKKASGKTEAFDLDKLRSSLKKAGASETAISEVVADIENWVYDGVSTGKIYTRAYRIYRQLNGPGALLYKLKRAISEMGPTGFPFEHFIGELFKRRGYVVKVGQVMEGSSVSHEMDIVAQKDDEFILGECKFSHKQGSSVSIQVPLYVHSRVDDIVEKLHEQKEYRDARFQGWIFTNGRFSPDSIEYSRRKGITLMGWDYPPGNALKDNIEREKIFPITILGSLNKSLKAELMNQGIVTCAQLISQPEKLDQLGMETNKKKAVLKELEALKQ